MAAMSVIGATWLIVSTSQVEMGTRTWA